MRLHRPLHDGADVLRRDLGHVRVDASPAVELLALRHLRLLPPCLRRAGMPLRGPRDAKFGHEIENANERPLKLLEALGRGLWLL